MLIPAIVFITSALIFYTIAVWWEKSAKALKGRHLLLFWLGLICDTTGTALMGKLAGSAFQPNFHGITGALAVLLMLIHALWATIVHASKSPEPKTEFHKYSVIVWAIWLVPYISGLIFGVSH
jgi:uncharacterized repeat protein (TIGR03987 family)